MEFTKVLKLTRLGSPSSQIKSWDGSTADALCQHKHATDLWLSWLTILLYLTMTNHSRASEMIFLWCRLMLHLHPVFLLTFTNKKKNYKSMLPEAQCHSLYRRHLVPAEVCILFPCGVIPSWGVWHVRGIVVPLVGDALYSWGSLSPFGPRSCWHMIVATYWEQHWLAA